MDTIISILMGVSLGCLLGQLLGKIADIILDAQKKAFDEARYQAWKAQVGLAERGDVDEQTIRNMWDAMDDEDK